MKNKLLEEISKELGLIKYSIESEAEFRDRIIYSAIIEWGRKLVLSDGGSKLDYHCVDKTFLNYRLSQVVEGFLNIFECNYLRISNKDYREFSKRIIEDLILHLQISELKEKRKVSNSPYTKIEFKNNVMIIGEYRSEDNISVGLGRWSTTKDTTSCKKSKAYFYTSNYNCNEYFLEYCKDIDDWVEVDSITDSYIELLDKKSKSIEYKRVDMKTLKNVEDGYYIIKIPESTYHKRYIYKKDKGKHVVSEIRYIKLLPHEVLRLIYSYKSIFGRKVKIIKKDFTDCVELNINCFLPSTERILLNLSSWGRESYYDGNNRIVPKFLWEEIKEILEYLGLEIYSI